MILWALLDLFYIRAASLTGAAIYFTEELFQKFVNGKPAKYLTLLIFVIALGPHFSKIQGDEVIETIIQIQIR